MNNVTDISDRLPAPPAASTALQVGFGYRGQDTCPQCDRGYGVPVAIGLHLPNGDRLCRECANEARPEYGDMFDALDTLDGIIATAPTEHDRLVRILEIRRGIDNIHGKWLEDDDQ